MANSFSAIHKSKIICSVEHGRVTADFTFIFQATSFRTVSKLSPSTLYRKSIYVFPEMKLRALVHNSYIHVSVSDLYIPRIGLSTVFGYSKIGRLVLGIYKSVTDTVHDICFSNYAGCFSNRHYQTSSKKR